MVAGECQKDTTHISKNVTEADAAAHSREDEGGARRPLVSAISSLFCFGAENGLKEMLDSHLDRM